MPRHYDLLMEIVASDAALAGSFISTASLSLDPQLDAKWLVGMATVSQTVKLAASLQSPFFSIATRCDSFSRLHLSCDESLLHEAAARATPSLKAQTINPSLILLGLLSDFRILHACQGSAYLLKTTS